jgi:hypothetical protein
MQWISVRDRLPHIDYSHHRHSVLVLGLDKRGIIRELVYRQIQMLNGDLYGIFHTPYGRWKIKRPTHWIQLKEAPL